MARLNIDDSFWVGVGRLAARMDGDQDRAIGQALRFLQLAQSRYKSGRIVTEVDFLHEELDRNALAGIFAIQLDEGEWMARSAEDQFGWLSQRVSSGVEGGSVRSQAKRDAAIERERKKREANNSSELGTSKTISNHKAQASSPLPSSLTNSEYTSTGSTTVVPSEPVRLHWLAEVWNSNCGDLPKVKEISPKRLKTIQIRIKECADQQRWAKVAKLISRNDFCNGRLPGKTWRATFDYFIQPATRIKAEEGQFGVLPTPSKPRPLSPPEPPPMPLESRQQAAKNFMSVIRGPKRGPSASYQVPTGKTMIVDPNPVKIILENVFGNSAEQQPGDSNDKSQRFGFHSEHQDQELLEHNRRRDSAEPGEPDRGPKQPGKDDGTEGPGVGDQG